MGVSERHKEIKRRRHRKKKMTLLKRKLKDANVSEKQTIAKKIRALTPGARQVIDNLKIDAR